MTCHSVYIHGKKYKFASRADYVEWNNLRREYEALLNSDADTAPAAVEEVLEKKVQIERRGMQHSHV